MRINYILILYFFKFLKYLTTFIKKKIKMFVVSGDKKLIVLLIKHFFKVRSE